MAGLLYFNENLKEDGWGDGGVFARLKGATELGAIDFTLIWQETSFHIAVEN